MTYQVKIKRQVERKSSRLPLIVQQKFGRLVLDLRDKGPVQPEWPDYCKLEMNTYHCHLGYAWEACRQCEQNDIIIEVYYVGSREKAPY